MSPVRIFVSFAGALAAVAGLAGCYDLSAPDGPSREDFIRNRAASAANGAPVAEAPPPDARSALPALEATAPRDFHDEIEATAAATPSGSSIHVD